MFTLIKDNSRKLPLYETALSIFEIFIDGVRTKILDSGLLKECVDFLLIMAHEESQSTIIRIVIDCFAVIMIHLVVDDSN